MGNKIHLACWRGDIESLQHYTDYEWCSPQYRQPGVFGVNALHIIVYRQHDNGSLWYNLFHHMTGPEDLQVTFGCGMSAWKLAEGCPSMTRMLERFQNLLRARHFFRLSQEYAFSLSPNMLHSKFILDRYIDLYSRGLSKTLLPALGPRNIHSTLYPGAPSFFTPLFVAVLANDLLFLKALISKGAQPSSQPPAPEGNYYLLHLAARLNHHCLIPSLVKAGCRMDQDAHPFGMSRTPLVIAAHYGNLCSIKALTNSPGFDLQSSEGTCALHVAAREGQFHVIPTLVNLGCKVDDVRMSNLVTPLHLAAMGDHVGAMTTLLKLGANPKNITSRGETALHFAAEHGSSNVIRLLIQAGLSPYQIKSEDKAFSSPFFKAVSRRSLSVLKELVNLGYTADDSPGFGLLHFALSLRGRLKQGKSTHSLPQGISNRITIRFLEELIKLGCSTRAVDKNTGCLPIHVAAYHNDLTAIRLFIAHGCPKNAFMKLPGGPRLTPIQVAAEENCAEAIEILAANGCNVDFHHPLENPPLHTAICCGSLKAVRMLLNLGARVTLRSYSGLLPIHTAIVCNQIEAIEMLFNHGASVHHGLEGANFNERTGVYNTRKLLSEIDEVLLHLEGTMSSAELSYSELTSPAERAVRLLLKQMKSVSLNCQENFLSPLTFAILCKNRAAIRKLVELGANVNDRDFGVDSVLGAVHFGYADIVEFLIDLGAKKDTIYESGLGLMHTAIQYNYPDIVQTLIDKGCDPILRTVVDEKPDLTPFQLASLLCRPRILQILRRFVTDVNQVSHDHLSPLHLAILRASIYNACADGSKQQIIVKVNPAHREETVKLLLEYGCNVNATDEEGLTPLDLAVHYELESIVMILTKAEGERGKKIKEKDELRKRVEYLERRVCGLHKKMDTMEERMNVLETHQISSPSVHSTRMFSPDVDLSSKAVEGFLEPFSEIFMTCAGAKEVASELRRRKVIPEHVETKIERAPDRKTANGLLFDHLYAQGTFRTLEIVCDVFIGEQGYPRMNQLGRKMKEELMHRNHLHSSSINRACADGSSQQIIIKVKPAHQEEAVKLLLEHGCNVNATDEEGLTPLVLAVNYEMESIVMILTQAGGERGKKIKERDKLRKRVEYLQGRVSGFHKKVDRMEERMNALETHQMSSLSVQENSTRMFLIDVDLSSKDVERFLEPFSEMFMTYAGAKEVASELRRRKVIPERVETKIEKTLDRKTANGLLYDHLYAQGTFQTLGTVCDVFIGEQGYLRMNELGRMMKEELMCRQYAS